METTTIATQAAVPVRRPRWLGYALATTLLWGVWGACAGLPTQYGFPETLVYVVWALTMIPPALVALRRNGWRVRRDPRSVAYGLAIGLLGAGGQMVLFYAVKAGPAYLIFPLISLSPVITIALSYLLLRERTGALGVAGIVLAICALPLFDYAPGAGPREYGVWFVLALAVLAAWGLQAYFIKLANASMDAESIFFYMTLSALLVIPAALAMTDFTQPINYGPSGPLLAAVTQVLNAIGALTLVYAFRHGKALVVSPLVNAGAPLLTTLIAMAAAGTLPNGYKVAGIALALAAALCLALQPENDQPNQGA
ncbi:putative membrane protein [Pseudoduganella flava]|uniref:EamA family transporter n=1 Tax=Pseudoduganella flava TaxID=871742 RepID=A0A562PK91_9BURK|nr:DMT family transporter [Pseudoduganella flava]QGZ42322.1 EamA family transporter [Pseudoduganella flava]TWI44872.1 putative membrane protein [Pseudoduganella flava]